ncbi:MAG: (2Fe-2S)-binding protein, partial [Phycisphaerae bacterium]|nr:(2Fe-2S)-binding protein [Phycisphaerae bacterium]
MEKVTFTFNDHTIEAIKGQTVLQAVTEAGFEIPHYCFHPGLAPEGSCRLCAVQTGEIDKDGQISMSPKLAMSC